MKLRHLAAGLLVGALALTACGREGSPGAESSGPTQTAAAGVTVEGSPTFAAMQQRGRVVMGVRSDQPGLGFQDATTGQYCGFDIEIARLVAAKLGFGPDKLDYKVVPSAAREDTIERGEIDYYGRHLHDQRQPQAAGVVRRAVLRGRAEPARRAPTTPRSPSKDTLKGKKVCSVTGSTPIQRVKDQQLTEPENIVEFQNYSQCVDQLLNNQVDAVTTDDAILKGYAAQQPDKLKVVGEPFSDRAVRHRPEQGRRRAPRQDQRHPGGRGGRRDLEADLRRDARQVRLAGRPAAAAALLSRPPVTGWVVTARPTPLCNRPTTVHRSVKATGTRSSHERPARQPGPLRVGLRRHRGAVPGRRRRLDHRRHAARRDAGQPRPGPAGLRRGLRQHRAQHPADAGLLLLRLRLPAPGDLRPVVLRQGVRRADHLHLGVRLRGRALGREHGAGRAGRGVARAGLHLRPDPRLDHPAAGAAVGGAAADQRRDRAAEEHHDRRGLLGVRGRAGSTRTSRRGATTCSWACCGWRWAS